MDSFSSEEYSSTEIEPGDADGRQFRDPSFLSTGSPDPDHARPRSRSETPFFLRSRCNRNNCKEGHGLQFPNRISPSPARNTKHKRRHQRNSSDSKWPTLNSVASDGLRNTGSLHSIREHPSRPTVTDCDSSLIFSSPADKGGSGHQNDINAASSTQKRTMYLYSSVKRSLTAVFSGISDKPDSGTGVKSGHGTRRMSSATSAQFQEQDHVRVTRSAAASRKHASRRVSASLENEALTTSGVASHSTSSTDSTRAVRQVTSRSGERSRKMQRRQVGSKTSSYSSDEELEALPARRTTADANLNTSYTTRTNSPQLHSRVYSSDEEEWSQASKTDYTYSHSLSYRDKVTPSRIISSPNMSRRGLRVASLGSEDRGRMRHGETVQVTSPVLAMSDLTYRELTEADRLEEYFTDNSSHQRSRSHTRISGRAGNQSGATYNGSIGAQRSNSRVTQSSATRTANTLSFGLDESDLDEADRVELKKFVYWTSFVWRIWHLVDTVCSTSVKAIIVPPVLVTSSLLRWLWMLLYSLISNVLLLDTWLLMRTSMLRQLYVQHHWSRSWLLLLLLPLLLLLGWWLTSNASASSTHALSVVSSLFFTLTRGLYSALTSITSGVAYVAVTIISDTSLLLAKWQATSVQESAVPDASYQSVSSGEESVHTVPARLTLTMPATDYEQIIQRLLQSPQLQQLIVGMSQNKEGLTIKEQEDVRALIKEELMSYNREVDKQFVREQTSQEQFLKDQRSELSHLQAQIEEVQLQMSRASLVANQQQFQQNTTSRLVNNMDDEMKRLQESVQLLLDKQEQLALNIHNCCRNASFYRVAVEDHIAALFSRMMEGVAESPVGADRKAVIFDNFAEWMKSYFVARDDLESKLNGLAVKVTKDIRQDVASETQEIAQAEAHQTAEALMNTVSARIEAEYWQRTSGFTKNQSNSSRAEDRILQEADVRRIVHDALVVYDADKTGMVDFALESAGGSVISTRCTESFNLNSAVLSLFGIPLWHLSNNPRTVIQPGVNPGECWAFKGSQGYIVIQLSSMVKPTAFSLEHIPKSLSPTGSISSAPKEFSVTGLHYEQDGNPVELGRYVYNQEGEPLQFFPVKDPDVEAYPLVELRIHSNHGNVEYTCLYRFRVHGVFVKERGEP